MGFLVRKTQMLSYLLSSQPAVFARVYLPVRRTDCEAPSQCGNHGKSVGVQLNLLPYAELFRLRRTTLRAAATLYNPHSRN
jgi:hypothetical protein